MLLWLWIGLNLLQNISNAAPTSSGPTYDSEAEVLWNEGKTAIQNSRFQDAVNTLQRYVDRYPDKREHRQAQLYLADAYLNLGKNHEAVRLYTDFILLFGNASESSLDSDSKNISELRNPNLSHLKTFPESQNPKGLSRHLDTLKAQIGLCKAYLNLKKGNEAYLTAQEAEKTASHIPFLSELFIEALLVKAQALLSLNRNTEAHEVLESADKHLSNLDGVKMSPRIRSMTYRLKLDLKMRKCDPLNLTGPLDELQIRHHLDWRGNCLLEALLVFRKIVETGYGPDSNQAADLLAKAFENYHYSCSYPPSPPKFQKSKRVKIQYQKELSELLVQDFRKKSSDALNFLETWKLKFPASTQIFSYQLAQRISNLITRNP